MGTQLYVDCFSGISGDMFLGALVDSGLPLRDLVKSLKGLNVKGYQLASKKVKRSSLSATKVDVVIQEGFKKPLSLPRIRRIIASSRMPKVVQDLGQEVFNHLAEAEGLVHRVKPQMVQFHEVGVIDSLVDVMGCLLGCHLLGVTKVSASSVNIGSGFVSSAHGVLPVPGPAVAALAKGIPIYNEGPQLEMTTPTGMALLRTLTQEFGALPLMRTESLGYGAGTANPQRWPNVLRIMLGEHYSRSGYQKDRICQLETNIDDLNPQVYEQVMEQLFARGALDVTMTPVIMKRGRPGIMLQVLVSPQGSEGVAKVMLAYTTVLGLRIQEVDRWVLPRRFEKIKIPGGIVRMKIAEIEEGKEKVAPEYKDCKDIADKTERPVREVMAEALARYANRARGKGATRRPTRVGK